MAKSPTSRAKKAGFNVRTKISLYGALPVNISHKTILIRFDEFACFCSLDVMRKTARRATFCPWIKRVTKNITCPIMLSVSIFRQAGQ